jgi:cob(I)alamin adenosyltransferase
MVAAMDRGLQELEASIVMPHEFVVPGETAVSAALELARTILRRAERRAVSLEAAGLVPGPHLLPYLNRTADLLWVLARAAEQAETRASTPARRREGPGTATKESSKP